MRKAFMFKRKLKSDYESLILDTLIYILLSIFTFAVLYPCIYTISLSISSPEAVILGKVKLFPIDITFVAYKAVLQDKSILSGYFNTIYYSFTSVFITLLFCSMAAYSTTYTQLKGRKVILFYFTIPMFFSGGIIPFFLLVKSLGLANTVWAIALPGSVGMWNIVILRTNFKGMPKGLIESARIDGASHVNILFRIVLPVSKAIIATIGLFTLVGKWNEFFGPLLFMDSKEKWPLQLILRTIISSSRKGSWELEGALARMGIENEGGASVNGFREMLKNAAIIVSIGPIILGYPFIQKYFVKGTLVGSIKE